MEDSIEQVEALTREYFNKLSAIWAKPEPVSQLRSLPFRVDANDKIRKILQAHGVLIQDKKDSVLLTFPTGTTKKEILPRVLAERNMITLPDGYKVRETIIWEGKAYSYLAFSEPLTEGDSDDH